jgi:hypothetical protein
MREDIRQGFRKWNSFEIEPPRRYSHVLLDRTQLRTRNCCWMISSRPKASSGSFLGALPGSCTGLGDPANEGEPEADQHEDTEDDLNSGRLIHGCAAARDQLRRSQEHHAAKRQEPSRIGRSGSPPDSTNIGGATPLATGVSKCSMLRQFRPCLIPLL